MAKEDSFLTLKQQIKSGNTGNLYLFFGEEVFVKDMYLEKMKSFVPDGGFADFNYIFLDAKDAVSEKVDDALNSFPMMSEKKLVVIKNSGIFKKATEEVKNFWLERLADIPDYVLLIFDEQEADKRSVLYKAITKNGLAVEFSYMKDYEVSAWVVREAQKAGKKISKDAADYLVAMCDPGIANVKNELLKLLDYSDSEIYKSDIDKVVSKPLSIVVFDITDGLMQGNGDKVMSIIMQMKENRESAFNVLYLLFSAFDKMLYAKLLLDEGLSYDVVASRLKIAPFIAKKYIDGAKNFSLKFLEDRICAASDWDFNIKQGKIDEWNALLQYVFECMNKQKEGF